MSLKSTFCAKCGRETSLLASSLCSNCITAETPIRVPKQAILNICVKCKKVKLQGKYVASEYEPDYYLTIDLLSRVRAPKPVELEDLKILETGKTGRFRLFYTLLGQEFSTDHPASIQLKKTACPDCSKQRGSGQYDAKIQLRASPQIIAAAQKLIRLCANQISEVQKLRTGIDILFSSKSNASELASLLRQRLHLRMSKSGEAFSWDKMKGRPKYKLVILLEERQNDGHRR